MPTPKPKITDHSRIPVTDPLSAAADAFLRNLAPYEESHIADVLEDGVQSEIEFWITHNVENQELDDHVFEHPDVDPAAVAERVNSYIAGWTAVDVMEYGTEDSDEDDASHYFDLEEENEG